MKEKQLSHEEIISGKEKNKTKLPLIIITDGIYDTGNLGMIFRIADAVQAEKIIIHNTKPDFNYGILRKKSRNTSSYINFEITNDLNSLKNLKEKYKFVCLEKTDKSINYKKFNPVFPVCLVIGSERHGISQEILDICDISVHLPAEGNNTSINVATAAAVLIFEIHHKFNY